jgi:hypothetical protein
MTGEALRLAVIAAMAALAAVAAGALKPDATAADAPDLEALLPDSFGPWRRAPLPDAVLPEERPRAAGEAAAYRAYRDDLGRIVTVVAAYGPPLGDSVRLHRPEKCYAAQGYLIRTRTRGQIAADGRSIPVTHLEADSPWRREHVTYWLRSGANFRPGAASPWGRADGALLRVSTTGAAPDFALHRRFLEEFAGALAPEGVALLLGAAR